MPPEHSDVAAPGRRYLKPAALPPQAGRERIQADYDDRHADDEQHDAHTYTDFSSGSHVV